VEFLFTGESLISFAVLLVLEVILGIDNVIFVSIIIDRLPKMQHRQARLFWMLGGMLVRIGLLFSLSWLLSQKGNSIIQIFGNPLDLASIIMLLGGLFLLYKSVKEIHEKLEGEEEEDAAKGTKSAPLTLPAAFAQIILIDAVFSFDSIITAGGTAKHLEIMVAAVVLAMVFMFVFSATIARFIHQHPTIKMLAISFLVMIGVVLLMEGWNSAQAHEMHLKNYIYFSMAFSFTVEMLNIRVRKKAAKPVALRMPDLPD